jgi:hypothetical protein
MADKLQQLIQVSLDASVASLKEHVTAQVQNLQIQIGQLEVQLKTLNAVIADGALAKAKPRTTKAKAAEADAPADAPAADAAAAAPAAAAAEAPAGKKFAINPYVWFTAKYKNDAAFRALHRTEAHLKLMENEETIAKQKTEAGKHSPEAKYLWNHYKANDAATYNALTAQYTKEREEHDKPATAQQQVKEANSPQAVKK